MLGEVCSFEERIADVFARRRSDFEAYVARHLKVRDHAEDIVSDGFLSALKYGTPDLESIQDLDGWVCSVIKRQMFEFFRKSTRSDQFIAAHISQFPRGWDVADSSYYTSSVRDMLINEQTNCIRSEFVGKSIHKLQKCERRGLHLWMDAQSCPKAKLVYTHSKSHQLGKSRAVASLAKIAKKAKVQ